MNTFFNQFVYLGLLVSTGAYCLGDLLRRKTKAAWCNPLLIACIIVIIFMLITGTEYGIYMESTHILTDLLTPATVCLAIPLYRQIKILKSNAGAIIAGIVSGIITTFVCVFLFSMVFKLTHTQYVTLLPKSVTTAIGMILSEQFSGIVPVTVASILITGIVGNLTAPILFKWLRIYHPIARGIAIGTSSHVIGTARAIELGEIEGAMSSLSTVISGLLTAVILPFIIHLY